MLFQWVIFTAALWHSGCSKPRATDKPEKEGRTMRANGMLVRGREIPTVANILHAVKEWAKEHVTQEKIAEGCVVKTLRPKVPKEVMSNSRGAHYL
jgi:hypothetical protein